QLSLRTGFAANPQDYVPVSKDRAWVTRYEPNLASGAQPFDQGDDILTLDVSAPAIKSRIDLTPAMAGENPSLFARPTRAIAVGGFVYVLLEGFSIDFRSAAPARLVTIAIDTEEIRHVTVLSGLYNCVGLAVAPDERELAVTCSGLLAPAN